MATDAAEIANTALILIGVTKTEISVLDTDNTKTAIVARRFYNGLRKSLLRSFPWTFATKFAELTTEITTLPNDEWEYGYEVPTDVLFVRRVLNGESRIDTLSNRISFQQYYDAAEAGMVLLTDKVDPTIEYTYDVTDTTKFTADFDQLLAQLLAAKIAPVFGADATKLGDRAFKLYSMELGLSRHLSANEEQRNENVTSGDSDFLRARD